MKNSAKRLTTAKARATKEAKRRQRTRNLPQGHPAPVEFARDALLHTLRTVVHRSGLLVVDMMLVIHDGPPQYPTFGSPMRVGNTPWWLEVVPKPQGGIPMPEGEVPIARDTVVAVYLQGGKAHFFTWPPEDLLPESIPEAGPPISKGDLLAPLKTLIWLIYNTNAVPKDDASTYRRFHERVRAAVITEIAAPGDKRPLIDIVYDIAGGPQLEADLTSGAKRLTKATLLRSLSGESPS